MGTGRSSSRSAAALRVGHPRRRSERTAGGWRRAICALHCPGHGGGAHEETPRSRSSAAESQARRRRITSPRTAVASLCSSAARSRRGRRASTRARSTRRAGAMPDLQAHLTAGSLELFRSAAGLMGGHRVPPVGRAPGHPHGGAVRVRARPGRGPPRARARGRAARIREARSIEPGFAPSLLGAMYSPLRSQADPARPRWPSRGSPSGRAHGSSPGSR